ncbi:MAG: cysteine peptidase family C39 domain-containing protein, partial [Erysipelotrichaceae bacterium]
MRKKECVLQHDESDCATAAIATILRHYGSEVPLIKLRELIGTDESGTTLKGMVSGLKSLKFNVKAIRVKIESLDREVTMPLIAQTLNERGNNHFVVVFKISKRGVYTLGDPETGI